MSKDFDTTFSDAIDLAAAAARTPGAAAARSRGRERTVRKRIAISAMSFVLVAAGATAAFSAVSPNGGGTAHVVGTGPSSSASPSPSPSLTTGPTTSESPSPTATLTHPGTPTTTPPASNPGTTANPHQAVGAAWLAPGQMPFATTFQWTAQRADPQGASPIGQQLTPTVFYVANDTPFQTLTTCADPTSLLGRTTGAQHTDYSEPGGTGQNQASQFIFFFTDAASAQQTFTWIQSQYGSSCLAGSGVTITKTAGNGTTSATWLTVKGSSSSPDLPDYSREFFVLRGSTIAFVSIISSTSLPTSYDDTAELSAIAAHLCVYGGSCH